MLCDLESLAFFELVPRKMRCVQGFVLQDSMSYASNGPVEANDIPQKSFAQIGTSIWLPVVHLQSHFWVASVRKG